MSVYYITTYDVVDPDKYQTYIQQVMPLLQKHKAEILVATPESKSIEGNPRAVQVVLKFESEEAALGWYNDPAYESVKEIRFAATENGTAVISKQFVPPTN
ncbi:MAG: DUF1330 domain-containing protein [Melioribacteraceae bacterium]|nr:DUF1330 domain-containing protein [Melioribacteraceae bacterium]MCF8263084.1 DUF1330 domain-containing protein [Melioribacteraceae bacterium]MCF8431358.1 DUF1330 domain-containing protein [Melioribacteraceae bacterium]